MRKHIFYALEILLCLLCALAPVVLALWPQDFLLVLAYAFSHIVYPLAALFLPLLSALKGTNAFVCALPPFVIYLAVWTVFGLHLPALPTIFTLIFSVVGANIGAEIRKRAK